MVAACLALQAHAEGQLAVGGQGGGDAGYLVGASVVSANGHIGSGVTRYDIKPLWAFQLGPFRVSRSRANSLLRAGREQLETGVSTELDVFSDWRLGASLRLDNGRSFADDPLLRGLPDIGTTLRARLSARRALGPRWSWSMNTDHDLLGRKGGLRLGTGVNYAYPYSADTQWDFSMGLGMGNARYLQTHYGISLEGAQAIFAPIADRATGLLAEQRVNAFGRYIQAFAAAREGRAPAALAEAIAANKRDFAARFELAQLFWAAGEFTQAMDELLEIIMRDKAWSDELARKTYVAILEVMSKPQPKAPAGKAAAPAGAADGKPKLEIAGKMETTPADPVIEQYRRKLSMALF